jgi:hypothetical protein
MTAPEIAGTLKGDGSKASMGAGEVPSEILGIALAALRRRALELFENHKSIFMLRGDLRS